MIKTNLFPGIVLLVLMSLHVSAQQPVISSLVYDEITTSGVTLSWYTNLASDSKVLWMAPDSNYQPLVFTDSVYQSDEVTNHSIEIGNLSPATIYKFRVISRNLNGSAVDSGYFVTQSESSGKVEVFFNHTVDTSVNDGTVAHGKQNFETLIDTYINQANHSIDITLWEFSGVNSVATSLIKAKNRGVRIRFIYNYTADTPLIDSLRSHDIPVLKRNYDTTASMHNKFWIFDHRDNTNPGNQYLWTGSTNVSHAQFHQDRNNIIIIQDQSLCAVYTREFEEMWGSHTDLPDSSKARFGPQKVDNVPHILNIAGKRMEVYFSPSDTIITALTRIMLNKPVKSLFFCMYKFILPPVEDALHEIFLNGKQISGVFDSSNSVRKGSAFPRMKGHDVDSSWNPHADVFIDTIYGLLHHKYFITDAETTSAGRIIVTGSFNWEIPAVTDNDENFLVLYDPVVNNQYYQEWTARYKESGGSLIGSGIKKIDGGSGPPSYINKVFPNPCDDWTTIGFSISGKLPVLLELYDHMGRKRDVLTNQWVDSGNYEFTLDTRALRPGVYIIRLKAGKTESVEKLIIMK